MVFLLGGGLSVGGTYTYAYHNAFAQDGSGAAWAGMTSESVSFNAPALGTGTAQEVSNAAELSFVTTGPQTLGMWTVTDSTFGVVALKQLSGASVASNSTVTMPAGDMKVSVN